MTYAVEADLDLVWGAETVTLMSADPESRRRNNARISEACAGAAAIIDGYLARRYALPLPLGNEGRAVLRQIAVDIAVWRLASTNAASMTEAIGKRYEEAKGFLDKVSEGKTAIPLAGQDGAVTEAAAATSDADASPNEARMFSAERVFTRDRMRGL